MYWSRTTTMVIQYILFTISVILGIVAIILLKETRDSVDRELYYIFSLVVGTGFGCMMFRLFMDNVIWWHALVHTILLVTIALGRKSLLDEIKDDGFSKPFDNYAIDLLAMGIYAVQYISSFHFVVFRSGQTRAAKIFRINFHTFCGNLTFFACVLSGLCRIHIFPAPINKDQSNDNSTARILLLFSSAAIMWYLLLNPYFSWRRLQYLKKNPYRRPSGAMSYRRSSARKSSMSRKRGR